MSPDEAPIEPEAGKEIDEYMEVLTSTGRIKPSLARSLREQGLDLDGIAKCDREAFLGYKGVGERTSEALIEIGALIKERRSQAALAEFWEMLAAKRIRSNVIKALQGSGLDSAEKVREAGMDGLLGIKGIGEATANAIMAAVGETPPHPIEEAAAEQAPEAMSGEGEGQVKSPSFMDRITGFFRNLFKGKGSEAPPETVKATETAPAEPPAAPAEEAKAEEPVGSQEGPVTEPETEPGPSSDTSGIVEEGSPSPETAVEAAPEEAPSEMSETSLEDGQEAEVPAGPGTETPEGGAQQPAVEKGEDTRTQGGLFSRIMTFFKKPKETPPSQAPASDNPAPDKEGKEEVEPEMAPVETAEEKLKNEHTDEGPGPEEEDTEKPIEPPVEIKEFEDIPGIGKDIADRLRDAGYQDIKELREAVPEDLVLVEGIDMEMAERICSALKG